jgi:hypothetical protein
MLYAKPWEHPSAVAALSIVILLSARINSSTPAQLLLAESQQATWSSIICNFETSLREFLDPVVNCFSPTNTSDRQ